MKVMNRSKLFVATLMLLFTTSTLSAQSLSDLFSSSSVEDVITTVTGGTTLSAAKIVGEWDYVQPAVELSSDSIVSTAAGSVVSSQIETKIESVCSKVGISSSSFAFVFSSDGSFTSNIGSKQLGGSYSVDADAGEITLTYSAVSSINIGSLTASATLTSSSLSLLFPADKLLSLLSALGSSSSNSEIELLSSLVSEYNGMNLGFELAGEAAEDSTEESSTASKIEDAVSTISKWF